MAFLTAPSPAAADAPWQWEPGHAWWGWNYVTNFSNYWVEGPTNYWYSYKFQKANGSVASFAFFSYTTSDWCYYDVSGTGTWWVYAGYSGPCGGYNRPYVGYSSGNRSYVRSDTWTS